MKRTLQFLLTFLFIVALICNSFSQTDWEKDTLNNPIMGSISSSWDHMLITPFVVKESDVYKMWYTGINTFYRIGYATSSDGISWSRDPDNPLIEVGELGSWDDRGLINPQVIFDGSTYHMWYAGWDGTKGAELSLNIRLGYATSSDGINWDKYPANPVMELGVEDSWDADGIYGLSVMYKDSLVHLWYAGVNGSKCSIGYATSADFIHWEKDTTNNPVLKPGNSTEWDSLYVYFPNVLYNTDLAQFEMWYAGAVTNSERHIGFATSPDGIKWQKYSNNPVMSPGPEDWDSHRFSGTHVMLTDEEYKMWYAGKGPDPNYPPAENLSRVQIGYARADIEGAIYAQNMSIKSSFMQINEDTLVLNTEFENPNSHNFLANAAIRSIDNVYNDSISLYDDGKHADHNAGDGIWGNYILPISIENEFLVSFNTTNLVTGVHLNQNSPIRFTSKGPIIFEGLEFARDSVANPGDNFRIKLSLKNEGLTATAKNISATLSSPDSFVTVSAGTISFGDIAPGESSIHGWYMPRFSEDCPVYKPIPFRVDIASNFFTFWSDTFSISLVPATGIEESDYNIPVEFALSQNYPNPFNPSTIIKYALPKPGHFTLTVYNRLGQKIETLVNKSMPLGHHQVEFNGQNLSSGIYYYRIQVGDSPLVRRGGERTGEYQDVKKMILLK